MESKRPANEGLFEQMGALLGGFNSLSNILDIGKVKPPIEQKKVSYKESMTYMKQFSGKNILLTGASGTIGANIARKLMKSEVGHLVMFVRRDDMMDSKTKMRLQNTPNAHVEEIDFREPQRIEQKFTYCMKKHFNGKLDAVILCHGVVTELGVQNCSVPDYDQLMLVNVRSNVHLISLAFPFLKQSKTSAITLLTSTSGGE